MADPGVQDRPGAGAGRPMSGPAEVVRGRPPTSGSGAANGLVAIALVIGLLVGGGGMYFATRDAGEGDPFAGRIDTTRYQTVVLANDKVYFGQVSAAGKEFFQLNDAYFLRETPAATAGETPTRSLLHLNQELQAPENKMLVRRSEVVLIENLDKNSPIQKEITRQRAGK